MLAQQTSISHKMKEMPQGNSSAHEQNVIRFQGGIR